MKKFGTLYTFLFFVLYIFQSIFCGLLIGTFQMNKHIAQICSMIFIFIIIVIIFRNKEKRHYYGICFCKLEKQHLLLFALPLLNIPYFFIGNNGDVFAALESGIYVGVMEEIIFRGCLYRVIEEKSGTRNAIIISSILFGLLHLVNPGNMPIYYVGLQVVYAIAIGIVFAVNFSLTNSLLYCICTHSLVDITAFIGGDEQNLIIEIVASIICIVFAYYYVIHARKLGGEKWKAQ